ncbi:hypothetical protein [Microcoleus sp. bin38.metabat.b11b12b14.051]|uniref:hypothetical protein n=1 Tax=Microcoleus sp. bin38.metabat.b11b12b14.051 TaxID=2742709 RepID=UPI0025F6A594|nr:hypothetical protein [Microcoleus sp. bin38.metabat.b11b12b14.051]
MNSSLVSKFQAISAILSEIGGSLEWAEYCQKANIGLTELDDNYSLNEAIFYELEDAVRFFLIPESDTQENFKNRQEEFDEESKDAAMPFIWDLLGN